MAETGHFCVHERDFGVLEEHVNTSVRDMKEIKETTKKIFKILDGNGNCGLVARVAVHDVKFRDLPSPRQMMFYSTVGGGVVMFVGLIGFAIIKAITGG